MNIEETHHDLWLVYDETLQRHALDGKSLTEGDEVEVELADGTWVRGCFEIRPGTKRRAALRFSMAGIDLYHHALLNLPDFPVLARWPSNREAV